MAFQRLLKDFGGGKQTAMQAVQIMDICGSSGAFELDENIADTVTAICWSGHVSLLKL